VSETGDVSGNTMQAAQWTFVAATLTYDEGTGQTTGSM
jgi:hypothetical protein